MRPSDATTSPVLTAAGASTRERIVRVASELMHEHGVRGTSIPSVQAAAGVSASQIYHYFGNKQGLVLAVIDHQTDLKLREQQSQVDNLDSIEALRAWCEGAAQRLESVDCVGGCEIGSLASELAETDLSVRADLVKAFDRWEAPIRTGLGRMQARGELDGGADVDRMATALLAAVEGGMLLAQIHRSATPYRHAVAVVIDQIESCTRGRVGGRTDVGGRRTPE